jgi:hypothetical protein
VETPAQEDAAAGTNTPADTASEATAFTDTVSSDDEKAVGAPYFTKGVYANYAVGADEASCTYFYVFPDETYGHTDDGAEGIGLPFDCVQSDGTVSFTFGGAGEEESVLKVTAAAEGVVKGYFEDVPDRELEFHLLPQEDPETFSAENYVNGPENSVYHDANGWSVRYDDGCFDINRQDGQVFIVYTGESAGTNMITVTYTVENGAEAAIKELGESWGSDAVLSEGHFPGAPDDVKGYRASLPPAKDGSGLYMEAVGRDYMDGALIFELTGHREDDEEMNMEVSDRMAGIIDSLTFESEN